MKKKKTKRTKRRVVKRKVVKRKVSKRKAPVRKKVKRPIRKRTKTPSSLKAIGVVTHYFPKVRAGVIKMTKGTLALGDMVHLKGHTTDFKQKVDSLQLDHVPIEKATEGQEVGMRVKSRVRQNDAVFLERKKQSGI